jgi:hypothetical protein
MKHARILGSLASLVLAHSICHGSILVVPDQFPSIQAAITSAVEGDTVLIRPGTYHEALTWANKNLTLLGDGVASQVAITASFTSSVMIIGPGVGQQSVIENLMIRDGRAKEGAGIKLVGSAPTIRNCRFESNWAEVTRDDPLPSRGAALFVSSDANPLVTDCSFIQNRSMGSFPLIWWPGDGGAIYVQPEGTLEVRRSHFEENEAWGFEGGLGGAIHVNGPDARAVIDNCTFDRNLGYGGGVWSLSDVTVSNCIFRGNDGYAGAAVYSADGTCLIDNNQVFDNVVVGLEGGVIVALANGQITNNTVAFNEGPNGDAGISAYGAVVVARNIICGNLGWGVTSCPLNLQDFNCNDVWGNTIDGNPADYRECDMTGMNDNISADPLFCAPQVRNFYLDANSPCAGDLNPCGLIGALDVACGIASIEESPAGTSASLRLLSPQPVASGSDVRIALELRDDSTGRLAVYGATGRCIAVLNQGALSRGRHEFLWRTTSQRLPSGVYYVVLTGEGMRLSTAVVLL